MFSNFEEKNSERKAQWPILYWPHLHDNLLAHPEAKLMRLVFVPTKNERVYFKMVAHTNAQCGCPEIKCDKNAC